MGPRRGYGLGRRGSLRRRWAWGKRHSLGIRCVLGEMGLGRKCFSGRRWAGEKTFP